MQFLAQVLVPLSLLLVVYCTCNCCAMETHLKCSACEAVAAELQRRLEAELPRQQLDLRHRLDKDGQRYGKVIDWRLSEIRAVNLLEDLCDTMNDYTLVTTNNTEIAGQQQQPHQQHAWIKYRGDGSSKVDKDDRPDKPEEELRKKQLTTFCGLLLESHEEQIVEALMTDQFAGDVTPVLCQKITSRCKDKVYSTQTISADSSSDLDISSSSNNNNNDNSEGSWSTAGDEL